MPEAAYADFWKTIQAGGTWQGVVKNRRKNGDHYWVQATVAPLRDGERLVGYTSIRRKALPKAVTRAEKIYAEIREKGKSRHYKLVKGGLQRKGVTGMLSRFQVTSLKAKLICMVLMSLLLLSLSGGLGVYALMVSGERLETLNRSGLQDVATLQRIERYIGQAVDLLEPVVRNPRQADMNVVNSEISLHTDTMQSLWATYYQSDAVTGNATEAFNEALTTWNAGVNTTLMAIQAGNGFAAFETFNDIVVATTQSLRETNIVLVEQERAEAEALLTGAESGRKQILIIQLALLAVGFLVMIALSMMILKSVFRSIVGARYTTFQIAAGNLANQNVQRTNERTMN